MFRDDWLARQIQQMSDAIARAFDHQATGLFVEALEEIEDAWESLLPHDRDLLEMLDGESAARMLGEPSRVRAAAGLYRFEADLQRARGELVRARACTARALALLRAVRASAPDPEDDAIIEELERALDASPD